MTAKQFNAALDTLGLTQTSFAALVEMNGRTIRGYALSEDPVPRRLQLLLEAWLAHPGLLKQLLPA